MGKLPPIGGQANQFENLGHVPVDIRRGFPLHLEAVGNVLEDTEVGEQGIILEDETDVALVRHQVGDILFPDEDASPVRSFEAGDHAERCRLPAARGTKQREKFSGRHLQADVLHGRNLALDPVEEGLVDLFKTDADRFHERLPPENVGHIRRAGLPEEAEKQADRPDYRKDDEDDEDRKGRRHPQLQLGHLLEDPDGDQRPVD